MIQLIFKSITDLFVVLSTSVIYDQGGFKFTILSLFLTIIVVNIFFDILLMFFSPKVEYKKDFVKNMKTYHKNNFSKDGLYKKRFIK